MVLVTFHNEPAFVAAVYFPLLCLQARTELGAFGSLRRRTNKAAVAPAVTEEKRS